MLRGEMAVGLGNDGFSNDMFAEMKVTDQLHKVNSGDPRTLGADKVLQMAVYNNRRLANAFFEKPVGILAPGAFADLILARLLPYDAPAQRQPSLAYTVRYKRWACTQHNLPR